MSVGVIRANSEIQGRAVTVTELEQIKRQLSEKLAVADALELRYRRALRRDLVTWIVLAAVLGALVGYGVATALIDPVTVLVPCDGGVSA